MKCLHSDPRNHRRRRRLFGRQGTHFSPLRREKNSGAAGLGAPVKRNKFRAPLAAASPPGEISGLRWPAFA